MDLNRVISYSLRAGVVAGSSLSLLGLVLWGLQGLNSMEPTTRRSILEILQSAFQGNMVGVVDLGVIVLVATPIFRVLLSAAFFWTKKDTKYVGITLLVLGMIILGFLVQAVI